MNARIGRISNLYLAEISNILMTEIKDEDIKFVTITKVDVTADLSYAKVYFTVLDKEKLETTKEALEGAKGFIRSVLADRIEIRHTPELRFIYDDSIDYGNKIDALIDEIKKKDEE